MVMAKFMTGKEEMMFYLREVVIRALVRVILAHMAGHLLVKMMIMEETTMTVECEMVTTRLYKMNKTRIIMYMVRLVRGWTWLYMVTQVMNLRHRVMQQ